MQASLNSIIRKIIHIDMDCFFAAVEIRDNPALEDKPVAVGGPSGKRGVLCTCNYEARKYGITSAMPTWKALQQCPSLIILPVNIQKYKAVSKSIHRIFKQFTDNIEPLSLDEAFLDVSDNTLFNGSATLLAEAIRKEILQQENLTASAGISFNKFLAKIASAWNKPNGQYTIRPEDRDAFMTTLPIEKIYGVGKVTALKLHQLGMHTCGDLQAYSIEQLVTTFGKSRSNLYFLSRGIDHRAVQPVRLPKSVSVQETYAQDLMVPEEYAKAVQALHTRLLVRLQKHTYPIRGIFIKLRFSDFTHVAKEIKISNIDLSHWYVLLQGMLPKPVIPIRSIAMGVRLLHQSTTQFHNLFPELV
jgi:DNA polymerase-4